MINEELGISSKISKLENKVLKLEEKNNKHKPKNEKQEEQKKKLAKVISGLKIEIDCLKELDKKSSDPRVKVVAKKIVADRKKIVNTLKSNNLLGYIKALGVPVLIGGLIGGINYLLNSSQEPSEDRILILPKPYRFDNINSYSEEQLQDLFKKSAIFTGSIGTILGSAVSLRKKYDKTKKAENIYESFFNY